MKSFMKKIITVSSVHKEKISYFFVSVISFFAVAIIGVLGFSFFCRKISKHRRDELSL